MSSGHIVPQRHPLTVSVRCLIVNRYDPLVDQRLRRRNISPLLKRDRPDFSDLVVSAVYDDELRAMAERPHVPTRYSKATDLPEVWHSDGTSFPFTRDVAVYADQVAQSFQEQADFKLRGGPFFRSGHVIVVCTDFVLQDNNYFDPGNPPILWETMIRLDDEWLGWQWRYLGPQAALRGHRVITEAIRRDQRERAKRMWR